ncbi:DNA excision repair protein ERCC-6-like [Desmophyllum pertusum]|uniref:DNA excision repair protein ERCC-6-like n=1 Tax=Desmophyllum pertusum TaxID=174260 RepID=A0A9W9YCN5_9CNID|nr:DNA excision repair protein ERCC-6-like [Desmophyllum pertusum]
MESYNDQLDVTTELLTELSIKPSLPRADSQSDDSDEDKARFNHLIKKGKELGRQGHLERALDLFGKAYDIFQSEKLLRRIEKIEEAIQQYKEEEEEEVEEEEDDGMREVGEGFSLPAEIYQSLYPYQLKGILWFWKLYKKGTGGILGDDMGLGKTIQVIAFLAGMFDAELIKRVLIVMPVSLITNWEKEFSKWAPGIRVKAFHGTNKKERTRNLEKIQRRNGVCLTTYGLIVSSHEQLGEATWDYILLDEGHKIKNSSTKTSKNLREIPAKYHFILTGTPVQNNLREMWALFDFACEGKLLGTSRTFKAEYENPIVRARERDASAYEKRMGMEMSESLRKLIEPHFLRRTKAMVLENNKTTTDGVDGSEESDKENIQENSVRMPEKLTRKNDFVVWLYMSNSQIKIYSDFLGLERVKEMLMSTRSPLAELNVLKKICDHPRLLSTLACEQLGLDEEVRLVEKDIEDDGARSFATQPKGNGPSDKVLTQESGKMVFLLSLLENLKSEGHRCLVFSQSRKMLDIVQRVVTHVGHKILRIDGTITSTAERQHLINTFQTDSSYTCFLLTTQVGGVGITLTAADRVVIFDPSWNPASDAQAVDRVYRIGQKKSVVVYRLITCGTLEEKIYRKQIFKDALMKQTTGLSKNPFRYFSHQELRDLFTLDDPYISRTQQQLAQMHSHHRKTDDELEKHIQFMNTLNIFGISDHDLMYSQEAVETPDELAEAVPDKQAIEARVLRAQNLMAAEAAVTGPADNTMNARQKIQAKIDSEGFFVPKQQDTKRFQPRQFVKNLSPIQVSSSPVSSSQIEPLREIDSPVLSKTKRRKSISQRIEHIVIEESDDEDSAKEDNEEEQHVVIPDSRDSSVAAQNDSLENEVEVESFSLDQCPWETHQNPSGTHQNPSGTHQNPSGTHQCPSGTHVSTAIQIHKCACLISKDEQEKYEMCLTSARRLELDDNVKDACMGYMDALELIDSDLEVHKKVLELAEQMNLQHLTIETA